MGTPLGSPEGGGEGFGREPTPSPPPPRGQGQDGTDVLVGQLYVLWGDGEPGSGVQRTEFRLVDDRLRTYRLAISEALLRRWGGLLRLNRQRVAVAIDAAARQADALVVRDLTPKASLASAGHLLPPVTGSQPWVTILCRFGDSTNVTPHPKTWFETLMGNSYPGMDHFWQEVSYNQMDLAGSVVVGWYDLPQPRSYYVYDRDGDGEEDLDHGRAITDCTAAADKDVYFPDFRGINLMFNETLGCCAWGGSWTLNRDGTEKHYSVTWMPPWGYETQGVLGQEMGHGFGLPHSSGPYQSTYDSAWDVMSRAWGMCQNPHPDYGCIGVHTIAYHKDLLGWIPPSRKYIPSPGSTQMITLDRLANPPTSTRFLLAQIPLPGGTQFYTVELRTFSGYDVETPGQAVVIHRVDPTRVDRNAQVVDVDDNQDPNDVGAMLLSRPVAVLWNQGETYTDPTIGLEVEVLSESAGSFDVRISYNPPSCDGTVEEDFETGDLSKYPWTTGGDGSWAVASDFADSGTYSAKSPPIADNQSSYLEVTLDVQSGAICFSRKVSSESGYDFLEFYIDGQKVASWSGDLNFGPVGPFGVTAGTHTFRWVYVKDSSVSAGQDAAWIDDIDFPPIETGGSNPTSAVFSVANDGTVRSDRAYFCGLSQGCFNAGLGADLAERIDVTEPVEPGDVIEIDPHNPERYRKARQPLSSRVVGVIATAPGITLANSPAERQALAERSRSARLLRASGVSPHPWLSALLSPPYAQTEPRASVHALLRPLPFSVSVGVGAGLAELLDQQREARVLLRVLPFLGPGRPLLALMGRVYVKATTENGPIAPGDLLTTASKPGYAMRCPSPKACVGALLGKALEPLPEGEGLIEVLLLR